MQIGERIRELRKQRRLTQVALALRLNVTHATVSRWETGVLGVDANIVPQIARALGVKPGDLFSEDALDESEDHDKRREELIREGYDIFRTLGQQGRQSINEGTVLEAIRQLLRELDEQKDS